MKKNITIAIVALFVIGAIAIVVSNNNKGEPDATTTPVSNATSTQSYTLADVAKHPDAASCWTTINGKVYDVTTWISQHPGGPEAILSICGKDGSAAFNNQHGGQRRPEQELATFYIGDLSQ